MENRIIGIAEMGIIKTGQITTLGLGSCVGVVLYDQVTRISGMVHVLLPSLPTQLVGPLNHAKFAESGVPELFVRMLAQGAKRPSIVAKMAGGAHMFGDARSAIEILKVGERNVKECKNALTKLRIPLIAEDTLGQAGRTIIFTAETGMLLVKMVGRGEKTI